MSLGGLILAGGQGSRMGYRNKGLMTFDNAHLIDPAINVLKGQCEYVAISANQDIEAYQKKQFDVWKDIAPWLHCGPLGGVCSSVDHFPESIQYIQVLACDTPFIEQQIIEKLSKTIRETRHFAVYAKTSSQIHPTIFQFHRSALSHMKLFIQQQDKLGIRHWLTSIGAYAVEFKNDSSFININDEVTLKKYDLTNRVRYE